MALRAGLDTVAIASFGNYTKTYGSGSPANIANLHASLGFIEDAVNVSINIVAVMMYYIRRRKDG
jgi:hypothetical protein